jgi:hypothetical protein
MKPAAVRGNPELVVKVTDANQVCEIFIASAAGTDPGYTARRREWNSVAV